MVLLGGSSWHNTGTNARFAFACIGVVAGVVALVLCTCGSKWRHRGKRDAVMYLFLPLTIIAYIIATLLDLAVIAIGESNTSVSIYFYVMYIAIGFFLCLTVIGITIVVTRLVAQRLVASDASAKLGIFKAAVIPSWVILFALQIAVFALGAFTTAAEILNFVNPYQNASLYQAAQNTLVDSARAEFAGDILYLVYIGMLFVFGVTKLSKQLQELDNVLTFFVILPLFLLSNILDAAYMGSVLFSNNLFTDANAGDADSIVFNITIPAIFLLMGTIGFRSRRAASHGSSHEVYPAYDTYGKGTASYGDAGKAFTSEHQPAPQPAPQTYYAQHPMPEAYDGGYGARTYAQPAQHGYDGLGSQTESQGRQQWEMPGNQTRFYS